MPTSAQVNSACCSDNSALARSVLYASLALSLRPPSAETKRMLASHPNPRELLDAAGFSSAPEAEALGRSLQHLASCARMLPLADLRDTHARLFGHTTRGTLSAYETEYGQDTPFQQPQQLSDIGGFLQAFGLQLDSAQHERIDHVSAECEFLAFLSRKEAWAADHSEDNMLQATRHAHRLFLKDHLGRFARALGRVLAGEDANGFYGAAGNALQNHIILDCRRVGVASGPEFLPLRRVEADATPMACSSAEDLLQIRSDSISGA